uniref:Uncharacterized protein n=1 Tax=Anguilla anguilla TaxID=7936 RepID=A0A0E9ULR1_ANGAN
MDGAPNVNCRVVWAGHLSEKVCW